MENMKQIDIDIQNFHRYMAEKWNIYLQTKQCNICAVCGDPFVNDDDYEYPYGKDSQGCCKICFHREFIGEPTNEERGIY